MFIRFDVIHERDRRTDRRTDGLHNSKDHAYASHRTVKTSVRSVVKESSNKGWTRR